MSTLPAPDERVPAAEANRSFSRLLRQVQGGKSFIVTSHGRPVARLTPVSVDDAESARRVEAHKALMDHLRSQPALDPPMGKFDREKHFDEMASDPFKPDWLQE